MQTQEITIEMVTNAIAKSINSKLDKLRNDMERIKEDLLKDDFSVKLYGESYEKIVEDYLDLFESIPKMSFGEITKKVFRISLRVQSLTGCLDGVFYQNL